MPIVPALLRLAQRPWQWLLLAASIPFVWAAGGVSISNMVITSVKQLSFAQATAEVAVNQQFTQTANVRLSPGIVTYRSSNAQVATVNAQTGQVNGVLAGEATIIADQAAAPPYPAASASYTIKVKGQAVVFNAWTLAPLGFGTQPQPFVISPVPTSNSQGEITYSLLDANNPVASITPQGLITVKAAGKTTIVATQAAHGSFESGRTQAVLEVTQGIASFTWPAQTARLGSPLTLQDPTDSTNRQGTFSYTVKPDSQGRTLATVAGKVLTPVATGETLLTVTQAGTANYAEASRDVKLTVVPGSFTITGFSVPPRRFDAVDPNNNKFQLTEPAKPLGSKAQYTFKSSNEQVATVSGTSVTVLRPGEAGITASLSADPALHDATETSAQLIVSQALPAIGLAPVATTVAAQTVKINVTSNSDAPLQLTLQNPQPADFAALSKNAQGEWIATIKSVGKASLVATQDASASGVFAAGSAQTTLSATAQPLLPNTLTLSSFERLTSDALSFTPPWTNVVGDSKTIEVTSSDPGVATVGGDKQTLTLTGKTGPTQLHVTQPPSATHAAADITVTLTVRAAPAQAATLYFTPNVISKTYGDAAFTPSVFSNVGDALPTFSIDPAGSAVAQVDGTGRKISILRAGTATIRATVSSPNFATTTATATLEVALRDPGLSLSGALQRPTATEAFDLTLSTLSGGALSVSSSAPDIATATIVGTPPGSALSVRVTPLNKAGNVTLTIHQEPDAEGRHKVADIAPSLSFSAKTPSIAWGLPKEIVFTAPTTTVTLPEATSSNTVTPITYAINPAAPFATLNGRELTLTGTGVIGLVARQAEGNGFGSAELRIDVQLVAQASGTLTTTTLSAPDPFRVNLDGKFEIPFTTNSDAPVRVQVVVGSGVVELDSTDPSGHRLIAKQPGEATVLLTQAATATHSQADKSVTVVVAGSDPISSWPEDPLVVTYDYLKSIIELKPPQSLSAGAFTYSLDPAGPKIANVVQEIGANRLQLLTAGETTLYAHQAAQGPYPADTISKRLIVLPQDNRLAFDTTNLSLDTEGRVVRYPLQSPTFSAKAASQRNSLGKIAYSSSRLDVATIDANGLVTVQSTAAGKETVLTATQEAWGGIQGAQAQLVVKVQADATSLTLLPFEMPLGSSGVPPYSTTASERAVQVSVSDQTYASVSADKTRLSALREGSVQVTVTHPATATQAAVSATATMTITARRPTLSVQPARIDHVWTGAEATITLSPSSDNTNGVYRLSSSKPALAAVNGLQVTLQAPSGGTSDSAMLYLTQEASNGWGSATVEIPVRVSVQAPLNDLTDMSRRFGEANFDLPATLNNQAVTYSSTSTATATVIAPRTVHLVAVGKTLLQARNAAGTVVKEATLTVLPGDPLLALNSLGLPSTTIERQLAASREGTGAISYQLLSGEAAEVRPNGLLLVKGAGTVTVQASVAAAGNYDAATTTAQISIADGVPGVVLTAWPTQPVALGEEFQIRFRSNFLVGNINGGIFAGSIPAGGLVSKTMPSMPGEEGVFRFKLDTNLNQAEYVFSITDIVADTFTTTIDNAVNDPQWRRVIPIQFPTAPPSGVNLGPEIVLTYNPDHPIALPKTYDEAGNVIPDNDSRSCGSNPSMFRVDNGSVLAQSVSSLAWHMVGLGQTWMSCVSSVTPRPVLVTVLPASPEIQGFDDINLNEDSPGLTLVPPSSLNKTGAWTYTVENLDSEPGPVAAFENGKLVPKRDGRAMIRATQAASGFYAGGTINALLTVNPVTPKNFGIIYATFGDPAFPVPRPDGIDSGVSLSYRFKPDGQNVATIVNGNIQVLKAGRVSIEALQGQQVVAEGQLIVDKAQTRLVFRLPMQALFTAYCHGGNLSWPVANRPDIVTMVKGTLETNNPEGALAYVGGGLQLAYNHVDLLEVPVPTPYYWLNLKVGHDDQRMYSVRVDQAESDNFYGASSATLNFLASTQITECSW